MSYNYQPLQRTCAPSYEPSEEEKIEARNYFKTQATIGLNDFVRGEFKESGIGGLIDNRIENFINLGANINNTEHEDGNTPLIAAVMNNDIEIVSMLLFYEADVMAENSEGLNVFDMINCVENETGETFSERIIELLLANSKNAAN